MLKLAKYLFKPIKWIWNKGSGLFGLGVAAYSSTSKASATARTLFKVADFGLTAYTIYDVFVPDEANADSAVTAARLTDAFVDKLTPTEVALAVSLPIIDREAVSLAFARQGTAVLADEGFDDPFVGVVYLAASSYIMESDGQPKLGPDELHQALVTEFGQVLVQAGVPEADLASVAAAVSPEAIREMPTDMVMRFDFVIYAIGWIAENVMTDPGMMREMNLMSNQKQPGL